MFSGLIQKIKNIALGVLAVFSLFLLGRNSRLSKKNQELNKDREQQAKTIDIQKRVIDVAKNIKPTDIAGNIKRMREGKF